MFKIKRDTLSDVPHVVTGLSCVPSVASGKAERVRLLLKLPWRVVVTAATIAAAIVVAAIVVAVGRCLGALLLVLLGSP